MSHYNAGHRPADCDDRCQGDLGAFNVVRFYKDAAIRRRVILRRVTLAEAQAHCQDPETSGSTATGKEARRRTRMLGDWFDGYERHRSTRKTRS